MFSRNLILKSAVSKNLMFNQNFLLRNTKYYPLKKYHITRSFHSGSQATIVPLLPTLLFSVPLCIPYFLMLRMVASRTISPQIRTKISYSLGSALLMVPTIFLFTSDTAPNTHRKRFMLLWPWEEQKLINKADECVQQVLGSEEIIPENDNRSKLINHILDRIWKNNINKNDWNIKKPSIYLIKNDDMLDGVSYPCSTITLTTSWLRLVDYDEDLLAAVLSHEIAHILQHHASEFYGLSFMFKALTQIYDMFTSIIPRINNNENIWMRPSIYLQKHSQVLEREADLLGQEIMANAGYDPAKAIKLWKLMCSVSSTQVPDESHHDDGHGVRHSGESSHPSREQRVKYLTENLIKVQKIYFNTNNNNNNNNFKSFKNDLGLRKLELTIWAIFG